MFTSDLTNKKERIQNEEPEESTQHFTFTKALTNPKKWAGNKEAKVHSNDKAHD